MSGTNRDIVRFYFIDVFTTQPLSGNPLAVVTGGQALSFEGMQRISREFNQSETTFILHPTRKDADWKLRSLTATGAEVFGAGHNALGAWWWLAESGQLPRRANSNIFMQEIGEHVLPVEIRWEAGQLESVALTQARPVTGHTVEDLSGLAQALTKEFPEDVESQCENCFRNISRALAQAGASLEDLVRVLIFVTSQEEFERIMPIIRKHCYSARPANTTVFAQLVAPHMRVEIEVMARISPR